MTPPSIAARTSRADSRAVRRLPVAASVIALAVAVATAGCASDPSEPAAPSPPPATLTPSPQAPVAVAPVDSRLQKRVELRGGPDYIGVGTDAVWVKLDNGSLVRIDPRTTAPVATVAVSTDVCQGLGVSGDEVWVCTDSGVARVDPATNAVVARVAFDKSSDQGRMPIGHGRLWLIGAGGDELVGVSSATNAVVTTVPLGTRCSDAAVTADAVWVGCFGDGTAVRVDPATGEVTHRIRGLGDARRISATANDVWVGYGAGLAHIDAASASVEALVDAAPGASGFVHAEGSSVWVRSAGRLLRRVDVASHAVVEEISAPERSGGTVAVGFGSVWTTAYDDEVLYRLRA